MEVFLIPDRLGVDSFRFVFGRVNAVTLVSPEHVIGMDSTGFWEKRTYDNNGNKIEFANSTGFWEKRTYNCFGMNTSYVDSDGNSWIESMNIKLIDDEELRVCQFGFDFCEIGIVTYRYKSDWKTYADSTGYWAKKVLTDTLEIYTNCHGQYEEFPRC